VEKRSYEPRISVSDCGSADRYEVEALKWKKKLGFVYD